MRKGSVWSGPCKACNRSRWGRGLFPTVPGPGGNGAHVGPDVPSQVPLEELGAGTGLA